jgi:hypothetical protein
MLRKLDVGTDITTDKDIIYKLYKFLRKEDFENMTEEEKELFKAYRFGEPWGDSFTQARE